MPRGSRPGERRGGRKRGTPNKKTALKNAVYLAAAASPDSSPLNFMLRLMRDPQVPLDDRIAMAVAAAAYVHVRPRSSAAKRTNPVDISNATVESEDLSFTRMDAKLSREGSDPRGLTPLEFLTSVIKDEAANPKQRLKAAKAAARYRHAHAHPEELPVLVEDKKFGFSVDPELARSIRDDQRRFEAYHSLGATRTREMDAEMASLRSRALKQVRTVQPPGRGYGISNVRADEKRLWKFWGKRMTGEKLTPEQDAEEAHLMVRAMAYEASPAALEEMKRLIDEHEKDFPSSKNAERAVNKPTLNSNKIPLQPSEPEKKANNLPQKPAERLAKDDGFKEFLDD